MILYTVVTAGLAITLGPFGVFNVALGVHVYVIALLAVKLTLVAAHILPDVVAMIGLAIAFKVKDDTLEHVPLAPITVPVITGIPFDVPMISEPFKVFVVNPTIAPQVYVVVTVGLAVVFGPSVVVKAMFGLHV